ncbi:hypothetical protein GCM10025876_22800 [Demequina litorisediminis]|uniref:Uncharacterized protein n=1 Tax=Demequina litorisediminis TaxID=1849022 RepID=A0ABQ6IFX1_9MICO|nr:hypothetical protein GCM10025876_22800 [Demequina litorisediminis]
MSSVPASVSTTFDAQQWRAIDGFPDGDITYHRWVARDGDTERDLPAVRIAFNRPEVRNAFRPQTVDEPVPRSRPCTHDRRRRRRHPHGQRPGPQGRRVGVLLGRRPAHSRP